ncbi:hypothetical protein LXL04_014023 [Taraxacum kok-saghyz]
MVFEQKKNNIIILERYLPSTMVEIGVSKQGGSNENDYRRGERRNESRPLIPMLVQVRTIIKFENGGTNLDRYKSHYTGITTSEGKKEECTMQFIGKLSMGELSLQTKLPLTTSAPSLASGLVRMEYVRLIERSFTCESMSNPETKIHLYKKPYRITVIDPYGAEEKSKQINKDVKSNGTNRVTCLPSETAAESCRRLPSELAARQVVKVISFWIFGLVAEEGDSRRWYPRRERESEAVEESEA